MIQSVRCYFDFFIVSHLFCKFHIFTPDIKVAAIDFMNYVMKCFYYFHTNDFIVKQLQSKNNNRDWNYAFVIVLQLNEQSCYIDALQKQNSIYNNSKRKPFYYYQFITVYARFLMPLEGLQSNWGLSTFNLKIISLLKLEWAKM